MSGRLAKGLWPHFARRGRRTCEVQTPVLASVVTEVLDFESQADPKFQTNWLFTRMTGSVLRSLLALRPELVNVKPPSVRTCSSTPPPCAEGHRQFALPKVYSHQAH